jgi:D-3-phosphoglycerate dehydrogenase
VNKSRDAIAYNIIDVEGDLDQSTEDAIAAISGVIRVRVI